MPHRPPPGGDGNNDTSREASADALRRPSMWGRFPFPKFNWRTNKREGGAGGDAQDLQQTRRVQTNPEKRSDTAGALQLTDSQDNRRVVPYLPRAITFRRQDSERREKLFAVQPCAHEKKTFSASRRRAFSASPRAASPMIPSSRLSLPDVTSLNAALRGGGPEDSERGMNLRDARGGGNQEDEELNGNTAEQYRYQPSTCDDHDQDYDTLSDITNDPTFWEELTAKWILNLSMHFRDRSDREKFFVTYAEEPNKWRRITVSCDYRNAELGSLEADLKTLHFQRDKSARIYDSIRESLPEIQFYDTVTNLKLETKDKRLHVHVTEDVNEIIPYPSISAIQHLHDCREIPESAINFEAHLTGFVYKVTVGEKTYIKKEIPSQDTVDEFLYEVNALFRLRNSKHVIQFIGVVTDEAGTCIKGLLIDFADGGALVDLLYNARQISIDWPRREKWARHIIQGLADIHEHGFVQGDFTLSNIVITSADNAEIIDINRRGCPVGWEPPELEGLIESRQRISMYIGNKTDLFQLGMVLWAIAKQNDEPEREFSLLPLDEDLVIPDYFRRAVETCLAPEPADRVSAKELLAMFPETPQPLANGSAGDKYKADYLEKAQIRATEKQNGQPNGIDAQPLASTEFYGPLMHQDSGLVEDIDTDDMGASAASFNRAARAHTADYRDAYPQERGRTLASSADMLAGIGGAGFEAYNSPLELDIGGPTLGSAEKMDLNGLAADAVPAREAAGVENSRPEAMQIDLGEEQLRESKESGLK